MSAWIISVLPIQVNSFYILINKLRFEKKVIFKSSTVLKLKLVLAIDLPDFVELFQGSCEYKVRPDLGQWDV